MRRYKYIYELSRVFKKGLNTYTYLKCGVTDVMLFVTFYLHEIRKVKKMLDFKNVAVGEVLSRFDPYIEKIIKENGVRSVQDLLDVLPKYPNVDWPKNDSDGRFLKYTIQSVGLAQKRGKEPILYETKQYEDKSLEYTDSLNSGKILLLSAPTTEQRIVFSTLDGLSVATIKKFLLLTDRKGNNYLVCKARTVNSNNVPKIINAINMYTDQVVRQSELTDSREENLFTYQQDEKKEIVEDKYAEIIAYLIHDTKEFVWGGLSDNQKKLYLSSVVNKRQLEGIIRDRMIENVANYTTLPELEKVTKGDYKVLKRFIKK